MFAIQAVRTLRHRSGGVDWIRHEQLPTFYVNGAVQGFTTEAGAAETARRVLDPFGEIADGDLIITAVEV
jgi:hypothetical protein